MERINNLCEGLCGGGCILSKFEGCLRKYHERRMDENEGRKTDYLRGRRDDLDFDKI